MRVPGPLGSLAEHNGRHLSDGEQLKIYGGDANGWLKRLLKKRGADEAEIDVIAAIAGKEIPNHFVPKRRYSQLLDSKKEEMEKYEAEVKEMRLNTAIKLVLIGSASDPDIVAGLPDKSKNYPVG